MRKLTVTIDWILMIALAIALICLIVGAVTKRKKLKKYSAIASIIILILLCIAFRVAISVPE